MDHLSRPSPCTLGGVGDDRLLDLARGICSGASRRPSPRISGSIWSDTTAFPTRRGPVPKRGSESAAPGRLRITVLLDSNWPSDRDDADDREDPEDEKCEQ